MYDIHCHILPDIDDGAVDIKESIEMAKIAVDHGITVIIATPHYIEGVWNKNYKYNQRVVSRLNEKLMNNNLDIEILLGNEVFITPDIIELLDRGEITTLNKSRYLLIELPMLEIPLYVEEIFFELELKGIVPIIAHPERNIKIVENPNILYDFILKGSMAQLDLPSIIGHHGSKVKNTAEVLLKHDMIHFIGTDAHSSRRRTPKTKEALEILNSTIGKEKLEKILYNNPEAIIKNQDIIIEAPKKYIAKWNIIEFIKSLLGT